MKRTYLVLIITMLVIGFAAVATNLAINGTINFGFNNNDFDSNVVFTYTNTMNGTATIQENGKAITFNTTKLENVGQQAIMDFDIANKSKQYDANVTIECGLEEKDKTYEDYLDIKYDLENSAFEIESGDTKSIRLTITLKKAYNESLEKDINMLCEIVATAGERNTEGTYIPKEHQYEEILLNGADPVLEASSVEGISLAAETSNKKLIPVIINDDGTVKRADTTKKWYDYENKEWANAVILADGIEDPGINKEIPEDQIESYFVWIPKYRYKIFDMGEYSSIDEGKYQEKSQTIEIEFGLDDTKDEDSNQNYMQCETPSKSGENGQCHVGDWMTHPAFTSFGDINGFWVGKFETGYLGATSAEDAHKDEVDPTKVIIKPNQFSWAFLNLENAYNNSFYYQRNLDSHMMKNTEWGAVAYLSHSKYGTCDNDKCNEIRINNNRYTDGTYVTGYSAKNEPTLGLYKYTDYEFATPTLDNDKTVNYTTKESALASTTGNYTGIYDMSGGTWEFVLGIKIKDEKQINNLETIDEKYYDLYSNISNNDSFDKRILGDATGEMGPFFKTNVDANVETSGQTNYEKFCSWNNDIAYFAAVSSDKTLIFVRGGYGSRGTNAGIFGFSSMATSKNTTSFRIVLAPQ